MSVVSVGGYAIFSPFGNAEQTYKGVCFEKYPFTPYSKSSEELLVSQFTKSQIIGFNPFVSRFDNVASRVLQDLAKSTPALKGKGILILATTKGNLEHQGGNEIKCSLNQSASKLANQLGVSDSLIVSNACSSGVVALIYAKRYLECNLFDYCVVVGAEVLSEFIISGFQSLKGLSNEPCRPFDKDRCGLTLGEGAAAILLTAKDHISSPNPITITGGSLSNDANHISGPSRTGAELAKAISSAINESKIDSSSINFISAHGTGTIFNDEMESKAFNLVGLSTVPTTSLKGSLGHTLGASGVIETALCIQCLQKQTTLPTLGFSNLGVPKRVNVCTKSEPLEMNFLLKTSSGFGGINATLILNRL